MTIVDRDIVPILATAIRKEIGGRCMGKVGRVFCFLLLVSLFLGPPAARAEMLDRIVAVVNNDVILYSELQQQIKTIKKFTPRLDHLSPQQEAQFERQVLEQMIQQKLADQQVKKLKIKVTAQDVDQTIAAIQQANGLTSKQLESMVHQQGKTMKAFRESLREDVQRQRLIERVFKSKTVITSQQVDQYLKSAAGSEAQARLHLALIFLPFHNGTDSEQVKKVETLAETIHEQLEGGASFATLAKEYSQGPAAQDGGDIGYITANEMAPPIAKAAMGLKVDGVTAPIKTSEGYYLVKILGIKHSQNTLDNAKARARARRELMQKAINKEFKAWMKNLEKRSFIQINL